MLELIVLGSIPGTDIKITFAQSLLGLLIVLLVASHVRRSDDREDQSGDITSSSRPAPAE
ncbi:MAG: hypothetical protein U5L95_02795 [Candidatus Saccharibacteria bacterium]|nr:hypothetical protein [Candidatus Saccharibacteria bacterium]